MEHLYVAQGICGLFKIGRSSDPTSRAKALQKEFVARGDKLEKLIACDAVVSAIGIEYSLQMWVAETQARQSGREWFVGGDFNATLMKAEALTAECRKRDEYEASPRGKAAKLRLESRISELQQQWAAMKVDQLTRRAENKVRVEQRRKAKAQRVNGAMDAMVAHLTARKPKTTTTEAAE